MPDELDHELADAEKLRVEPISVKDSRFEEVANSGTVKWAVLENGDLKVIPKHVDDTELKHPVLSNGNPVKTAAPYFWNCIPDGFIYHLDCSAESSGDGYCASHIGCGGS